MYLTVNYALQQFQIAPAVTQSVAALDLVPLVNPSSINCPPGPPDKAYIGVIVEGCVLAVVLIILIILGVYYFRKKRKSALNVEALATTARHEMDAARPPSLPTVTPS